MRYPIRLLPPLAYMAAIYLLSSIPMTARPRTSGEKTAPVGDAGVPEPLAHTALGGLAATWYWALRPILKSTRATVAAVFLVTAAYSFFDEWHQLHVPGRYGSLTDIALNLVGIVVTLGYFYMTARSEPQRMPTSSRTARKS